MGRPKGTKNKDTKTSEEVEVEKKVSSHEVAENTFQSHNDYDPA